MDERSNVSHDCSCSVEHPNSGVIIFVSLFDCHFFARVIPDSDRRKQRQKRSKRHVLFFTKERNDRIVLIERGPLFRELLLHFALADNPNLYVVHRADLHSAAHGHTHKIGYELRLGIFFRRYLDVLHHDEPYGVSASLFDTLDHTLLRSDHRKTLTCEQELACID
jgi:hypothetical protein